MRGLTTDAAKLVDGVFMKLYEVKCIRNSTEMFQQQETLILFQRNITEIGLTSMWPRYEDFDNFFIKKSD